MVDRGNLDCVHLFRQYDVFGGEHFYLRWVHPRTGAWELHGYIGPHEEAYEVTGPFVWRGFDSSWHAHGPKQPVVRVKPGVSGRCPFQSA